jgi:hypothetical protein
MNFSERKCPTPKLTLVAGSNLASAIFVTSEGKSSDTMVSRRGLSCLLIDSMVDTPCILHRRPTSRAGEICELGPILRLAEESQGTVGNLKCFEGRDHQADLIVVEARAPCQ